MYVSKNSIHADQLAKVFGDAAPITRAAQFIDANYQVPRLDYHQSSSSMRKAHQLAGRQSHNNAVEVHELSIVRDPFFPEELKPYVEVLAKVLSTPGAETKVWFGRDETASRIERTSPTKLPLDAFDEPEVSAAVQDLLQLQGSTDALLYSTLATAKGSMIFESRHGAGMLSRIEGHFHHAQVETLQPPSGVVERVVKNETDFQISIRATNSVDEAGGVAGTHTEFVVDTRPNAVVAIRQAYRELSWDSPAQFNPQHGRTEFHRADAQGRLTLSTELGGSIHVLDGDSFEPIGEARIGIGPTDNTPIGG